MLLHEAVWRGLFRAVALVVDRRAIRSPLGLIAKPSRVGSFTAPAFRKRWIKLESRFEPKLVQQLRDAGHVVELLPEAFSDTMGHAGALVRHPNALIEGAADPRSDGIVAGL